MKASTIIIVVLVAFGALLLFRGKGSGTASPSAAASNVSIVDGQQIVRINVKGGYQPEVSALKAGVPTVLRFETNGTFDCSSSVRIPAFNISRVLPPSGTTDIALGSLPPGTVQGTCSMGMYRFGLDVRS